ncbi:MAG: hypothetical protein ACOYMN_10080, partial [Roseimicrobium sp.]
MQTSPPLTLSDLFSSLDAATYFFVSSGSVIGITAAMFFGFGVWLGRLLWARYKGRLRDAEDVIEAFKGEVALLKRRIAEQASRPLPTMGPSPLQSIAFKAVVPHTASVPVPITEPMPTPPEPLPSLEKQALAPSGAFSVWTDAAWARPSVAAHQLPTSKAFSLWAMPQVNENEDTAPPLPVFPALEVFMVPRSHAFTLWTVAAWVPPVLKPAAQLAGAGFALWTEPDFNPRCCGVMPRSEAFSLWTEPSWAAPRISGLPLRSARSFSVWTEPGWKPTERLPWSKAVTLWTDADWVQPPVNAQPPQRGSGFALWTEPDFEPACRGALLASQAHAIWTEEAWVPPAIQPMPLPAAQSFSVWAEPSVVVAAAPVAETVLPAVAVVAASATGALLAAAPAPAQSKSFISRALEKAKQALGLAGRSPVAEAPVGTSNAALTSAPAVPTKAAEAEPEAPAPVPPAEPLPLPVDATPPVSEVAVAASSPQGDEVKAEGVAAPLVSPDAVTAPVPPPAALSKPAISAQPAPHTLAFAAPAISAAVPEPEMLSARESAPVAAVLATLSATAAAAALLHRPTSRVQTAGIAPSKAFSVWTEEPAVLRSPHITQRVALAALIESKVAPQAPELPPIPVETSVIAP